MFDLHCHTTFSDGTFTPEELIDKAKEIGLQGLSITDHDTISAYPDALPYAKKKGIALLAGIEFSTSHQNVSVHMLGYGFALKAKEIADLCLKHKTRRSERNSAIIEKLKKQGMPVELDEAKSHTIGRPHIAQAMVKKGYVASVEEAFKKYLGEHRPCYVPGSPISVEETLAVIHQAKGVAIIAHPHLITHKAILKALLKMPFDGIEVCYARFSSEQNQKWQQIAKEKGWIATGGSDFHGSVKPDILLGSSYIGEEAFKPLYELHLANNGENYV